MSDPQIALKATEQTIPMPVVPPYVPAQFGRWRLTQLPDTIIAGYFTAQAYSARNFALQKRHPTLKKKWETWMSVTPMELESHMIPVDAATGYTVIAGLGMGLAVHNICRKPEVTKVTVLEKDPQVINLFRRFALPETWDGWEKVEIIQADALNWKPDQPVQFLYADIWKHVGSRYALPFTKRMCSNIQPERVAYWTQEFDFVEYCATRFPTDPWNPQMFEPFLETIGIPLVGQEYEDYPEWSLRAVKRQISEGPQRIEPSLLST